MNHASEGNLRAFLDGELDGEGSRFLQKHLDSCASCRRRRDRLGAARSTVRRALRGYSTSPDLDRALRTVRDRQGSREGEAWPHLYPRPRLARAAVVVLALLGSVAAGLPGSPLRHWLEETLWTAPDLVPTVAAPSPDTELEPGRSEEGAGVRVQPRDGAVSAEIIGAEAGFRIRIRLVERESAGIAAGASASFGSGPGHLRVTGPRGTVTVELPTTLQTARVTADGRLLFLLEGGSPSFPTIRPDTAGGDLLFHVPTSGDGSGGPPPG